MGEKWLYISFGKCAHKNRGYQSESRPGKPVLLSPPSRVEEKKAVRDNDGSLIDAAFTTAIPETSLKSAVNPKLRAQGGRKGGKRLLSFKTCETESGEEALPARCMVKPDVNWLLWRVWNVDLTGFRKAALG